VSAKVSRTVLETSPTGDRRAEFNYYTELLARLFRGVRVAGETVRHLRYPGNAFDRQYEKFRRPFGASPEELTPEDRFRLRLCEVIFRRRLEILEATTAAGR
jgi:hypothetical protein